MKFAIENDHPKQVIGRIPHKRIFSIKMKYENQLTPEGIKKFNIRRADAVNWKYTESREKFTDETMKKAVKALKKAKIMKRLDLRHPFYSSCVKMTDKGLYFLGKSLSKLSSLQRIFLPFETNEMSDKGLFSLRQGLKKRRFLQSISLDFAFTQEVTNQGFLSFSKTLKRSPSLRNLQINFYMSRKSYDDEGITDENLQVIGHSLKRLLSLRTLSLAFECSEEVYDGGLVSLANSLKTLKLLQGLHLSFQDCFELSENGLASLCESFGDLENLKMLNLSFPLDHPVLEHISENLEDLICLESLSLNLSHVTDDGIFYLCDRLQELDSLKEIALIFRKGDDYWRKQLITNEGLQRIADLLDGLSSLERVTLEIPRFYEKMDRGMIRIFQAFGRLLLLKDIHITLFRGWMTDEGLFEITKSLLKIESLKSIFLELEWCKGLTEERVEKIEKDLERMTFRRNINFKFKYSIKVDGMLYDIDDDDSDYYN